MAMLVSDARTLARVACRAGYEMPGNPVLARGFAVRPRLGVRSDTDETCAFNAEDKRTLDEPCALWPVANAP